MKSEVTTYDTSSERFLDITSDVERFVSSAGSDGLVNVFVPHATAGVAVMETRSGSEQDLAALIERLLPPDLDYVHSHGSPGHGRDHVLPAFIAPSVTIPVTGGGLALGTWQSVVLVDTNRDNPSRKVRFSFLEG
ncbi:MAG: secondary thiamine-phosphate synthase enzyme YjbQ [Actinomycetota bacterium]|jgi:secondary thiamine-phosphate synthase enzyme